MDPKRRVSIGWLTKHSTAAFSHGHCSWGGAALRAAKRVSLSGTPSWLMSSSRVGVAGLGATAGWWLLLEPGLSDFVDSEGNWSLGKSLEGG